MTTQTAIHKLNVIKNEVETTELEDAVIDILINNLESGDYENANDYFDDLSHGCESGIVGELIYYSDTYPFAKKHLEDILELKADLEEELGEPIQIPHDTDQTNWLAWFGFEETVRQLANQIGLDY